MNNSMILRNFLFHFVGFHLPRVRFSGNKKEDQLWKKNRTLPWQRPCNNEQLTTSVNTLIHISYDTPVPTVSARDLHEALNVSTLYKDWFPRMCRYVFVEGKDYSSNLSKSTGGYGGSRCPDTNGAFLRFKKDSFRLPESNPLFQNTPYQESLLLEKHVA